MVESGGLKERAGRLTKLTHLAMQARNSASAIYGGPVDVYGLAQHCNGEFAAALE